MTSLFQFSIRSLLAAVTIVALGIVALLNANIWWEAAAWIVALVLLASAILLVVYRHDEKRAYWLGFAIFGSLYLGVLLYETIIYGPASNVGPSPEPLDSLVTTRISQMLYEAFIAESRRDPVVSVPTSAGNQLPASLYRYQVMTSPPPPAPPLASVPASGPVTTATSPPGGASLPPSTFGPVTSAPMTINAGYVSIVTFVSIAHSIWLLLAAAIGGKICQWFYRTRPTM